MKATPDKARHWNVNVRNIVIILSINFYNEILYEAIRQEIPPTPNDCLARNNFCHYHSTNCSCNKCRVRESINSMIFKRRKYNFQNFYLQDCQHNTEGNQCERCKKGYVGDARRGTPYDCQRINKII